MQINQQLIKELRIGRGWTQQHLADAVGLSLRTIQRIEKTGATSIDTVAAFASVFEVERNQLTKFRDLNDEKSTLSPQVLIGLSFVTGIICGAFSVIILF